MITYKRIENLAKKKTLSQAVEKPPIQLNIEQTRPTKLPSREMTGLRVHTQTVQCVKTRALPKLLVVHVLAVGPGTTSAIIPVEENP